MSLKETLQADLKQAMLAREADKVELLRGLKSAILYAEVAADKRDEGLSDEEIIAVLQKESKKRAESAELFEKGGNQASADKERSEAVLIDAYLPAKLSEEDLDALITDVMSQQGIDTPQRSDMGKIIGAAKAKGGAAVDGATLAKLVNQRINS
jgi:uncharacterized protein YqeY